MTKITKEDLINNVKMLSRKSQIDFETIKDFIEITHISFDASEIANLIDICEDAINNLYYTCLENKESSESCRQCGCGPDHPWRSCDHEWKEQIDSMYDTEYTTEVYCVKCQCPGDRHNPSSHVHWPST